MYTPTSFIYNHDIIKERKKLYLIRTQHFKSNPNIFKVIDIDTYIRISFLLGEPL